MTRVLLWAISVAAFLRFGLQPTGWLFYEIYFALGLDWLYWCYSGFRSAGYALSLWDYQNVFCISIGVLASLPVLWRQHRRQEQK